MYFRAGILQISRVKFWKIDDFKNCFQDLLTFSKDNLHISQDLIIFAFRKNRGLNGCTKISISHAFNETWRHFALLHQCRCPPKKPQFFLHPLCFKFSLGFRLDLRRSKIFSFVY